MKNELKKTIDKKSLFLLTANAILGTGIFFLPALGAAYAGSASILSWLIMSFVAIFIAVYFGELIAMFPKSGGVYEYAKQAFGDFPAFLCGWVAWIVANITISMLIVGSLVYLFPNETLLFKIVLAIIFVLGFNFVSYRGIEVSIKMLVIFGVMTIIGLLAVILPGIHTINLSNFNFNVQPFVIILGIYFICETFFGWETASYLAEEVKDAKKSMPRTLILTTIFISVMSLLLVFVALGNVNANVFAMQTAPLSFLAAHFFGSDLARIFTIIIFIPLIGTAASWIVSSPRLLYAMSRDKALPEYFQNIHNKYRTPRNAILFQTLVTIFLTIVALGDFYLLLSLVTPLVILMYIFVMISVVKLRISKPNASRPFKAPLGRIGPIIISVFLLSLLAIWLTQVTNALSVFIVGIILIVLGIPLYIIIKLHTSEEFTEKFFDRLSFMWDKTFPIFYSRDDVKKVVDKLAIKKNSVVLDFGCGSGITTRELAKRAP
ncbi:MAG: amino acid permease, partial [Candidatus Aenigmarchaeota archaeon]|nr:amino acid permease [Candidatus Aenigmarchaeota archaeon]